MHFDNNSFSRRAICTGETFLLSGDRDNDMRLMEKRRNIRCKGITVPSTNRQHMHNVYQKEDIDHNTSDIPKDIKEQITQKSNNTIHKDSPTNSLPNLSRIIKEERKLQN